MLARKKWLKLLIGSTAISLFMSATPVLAQSKTSETYPNQAITLIVPYAAGGSTDTRARQLAQKLSTSLGVSVVVENRSGASGNIGTGVIAQSKPDGYTIGLGNFAPISVNEALYSLTFKPATDLAPIALLERGPVVMGVNNTTYRDLPSLIKYAKANPGKLNFASTGAGSASHLSTELFTNLADLKATHVPYRGGAPALIDLVAGNVDFYIDLPSLFLPQAKGKTPRIKMLAVASEKRLAGLPDVPTFEELGIKGMIVSNWFGMVAPAGVSPEIIKTLNEHINQALQDPGYRNIVESQGGEVAGGTPAQFKTFIATETQRWKTLITKQKITAQ